MNSWIGKTKTELYQSWGRPNSKTDDGQGGEILIYISVETLGQTSGTLYNSGNDKQVTYITPPNRQYSRIRTFYVNSKGIIYSWKSQEL